MDRFLMGRTELIDRMTVLLGGRAAEALLFSDISTGAADDLMRATEIARSMVVRFGMEEKLGQVAFEPEQQHFLTSGGAPEWRPRRYSERTAAAIDAAAAGARAILLENTDLLHASAAVLLKNETISGERLTEIAACVHNSARLVSPDENCTSCRCFPPRTSLTIRTPSCAVRP